MRKTFIFLIIMLLTLPLVSCAEVNRYEASFMDVFDTFSQVVIYSSDKEQAQAIVQDVYAELKAYHQLYDIYNDYSGVANLKTVNDNAGIAPVKVDERLMGMIRFAREMYDQTDGRMNIAMGSVLSIWHDYRTAGLDDPEHAALPEPEALRAAAEHTDIHQLILDEEASTLYLADPAMRLDVGAVAKGYAVEQAAQHLIRQGVKSALLNIGGNIRAIGLHPDGTPWQVGVQNPDLYAEAQSLTRVGLRDLSLVSSGSYQRYYTVEGKAYHHIIDPDTLFPAEWFWAVTVVTEDSGLADCLSTALFTLSLEDGQALIKQFDGVEALWVAHDGSIIRSNGFTALAQESP